MGIFGGGMWDFAGQNEGKCPKIWGKKSKIFWERLKDPPKKEIDEKTRKKG